MNKRCIPNISMLFILSLLQFYSSHTLWDYNSLIWTGSSPFFSVGVWAWIQVPLRNLHNTPLIWLQRHPQFDNGYHNFGMVDPIQILAACLPAWGDLKAQCVGRVSSSFREKYSNWIEGALQEKDEHGTQNHTPMGSPPQKHHFIVSTNFSFSAPNFIALHLHTYNC